MTAYLLPQPQQFFDNNGDPLSGGFVYTCVVGASGITPGYLKDSYTDYSGSVLNSNPVVLDSSGRASIWGDEYQYKLFVFSSSNVLVNTIDNVSPILGVEPVSAPGRPGFQNMLHNPRFAVNQRAVSGTVTLAAGAYGHDRWKAGASGCTYTFSTSQGRTTLTISSGSLIQVIEGSDLSQGANDYTLSWGGTCQGKIGAGPYSASGVTGSATGGTNLSIEFVTGTLYEPQLELGSLPSPFSFKDSALDVADCKRYFNILNFSLRAYSPSGATNWAFPATWPAMRVVPTWTTSVSSSLNANSTTMASLSASSGYATIQSAASGDAYVVVKFTSSGADL